MSNTCRLCGSTKIMELGLHADVHGMEVGGTGNVDVVCYGVPGFWRSNDTRGGLIARVCGECGHAELYARDFRFLYEQYEKMQKEQTGP